MKKLVDEGLQVTLALSLHAPNDDLRRDLIPWAERVTIESLVEAANYYFDKLGRELTLEYILLGGVNDRPEHAAQLAGVARRMRCNVNLIPYNPVEGLPYVRPTDEAVRRFVLALRERGINAHVRRSRGLDIDGACGQLRRREMTAGIPLTIAGG
jgi:23S rRNA (adenine2503-C2)-methyltransferase